MYRNHYIRYFQCGCINGPYVMWDDCPSRLLFEVNFNQPFTRDALEAARKLEVRDERCKEHYQQDIRMRTHEKIEKHDQAGGIQHPEDPAIAAQIEYSKIPPLNLEDYKRRLGIKDNKEEKKEEKSDRTSKKSSPAAPSSGSSHGNQSASSKWKGKESKKSSPAAQSSSGDKGKGKGRKK
ncbi:hypothetical protein EJ08DRAFT_660996 [Tothia fuscella]|uniref:Uncharacterized protein n=1 Tax=Tothia fuscella TaxID=1048955 RepID=A0A9P4NQM7_9PEZI|nr:hypothetical protein EJ08DRAFT_660996 [Tothia fuscella]